MNNAFEFACSSFATVDIMRQYGILLEDFKLNGEFVNNCIFTMMHHIGGDLEHIATLFQPSILKSFSDIWETDYGLCDVKVYHVFDLSESKISFCRIGRI